jgi:hypothetical protein
MFKSINKKELYDNSQIAFVFEFFSPLTKQESASKIAKAVGKKVKWFSELNESFNPTDSIFKLSPTYNKGYREVSLSTGYMPYSEAVNVYLKMTHVIEAIGFTTERCGVKTKIRLDEKRLDLPIQLDKLNKLKYLLTINEDEIFNIWPQGETDRIRLKQDNLNFIKVKGIHTKIISESYIRSMSPLEFNIPSSDYFATDFSELGKGQLITNYISGKDYTAKRNEAVDTINRVIEALYETLTHNYQYTIEETSKLSKIAEHIKESAQATRSYLNFSMQYPDIEVYVNLKNTHFLIESNFNSIREPLFQLVASGAIKEAVINWDTDRQKFQIKGATIKKSILIEGVEFYDCIIEGDFNNCLFDNCTIKNSNLSECTLNNNNYIKASKIVECYYTGTTNMISSSYLNNSDNKHINAELKECLVINGIFTRDSEIDSRTHIINNKK